MQYTLALLAMIMGIVAAGLGIRAATVHVRNSQDDFITDLHRQSKWASFAAVAAGISSGLQAVVYFFS